MQYYIAQLNGLKRNFQKVREDAKVLALTHPKQASDLVANLTLAEEAINRALKNLQAVTKQNDTTAN